MAEDRRMIQSIVVTFITLFILSVPVRAASPAEYLTKMPGRWFGSDEGRKTLDCILSWQSKYGDWPKNVDTCGQKFPGDRAKLQGTFDNGATTGELRVLARAFRTTGDARYEKAFLAGFDHI